VEGNVKNTSTPHVIPPSPAVLIATLGTEPQVVTAALDLLLAQGVVISRVQVLHSVAPGTPIARAVETLQEVFHGRDYTPPVPLDLQPASAGDQPLADVETPQASTAAFCCLYRLVHRAKRAGERVHLSIAGGRKNLAIYGMVTAQMLFDAQDCLWHLYSGGDFLASKRLHPLPGDDVHLLPIPVLLRSYISPALTGLRDVEDALAAVEHLRRIEVEERLAQARAFVNGSLSGAEQRPVALLVQQGLADAEIAAHLNLSPRTVEQHLRSAYGKAADHWELEDVSRTQLVALLSLYYAMITGNPA
jgi:CRISPR-associated Csx14 family protein